MIGLVHFCTIKQLLTVLLVEIEFPCGECYNQEEHEHAIKIIQMYWWEKSLKYVIFIITVEGLGSIYVIHTEVRWTHSVMNCLTNLNFLCEMEIKSKNRCWVMHKLVFLTHLNLKRSAIQLPGGWLFQLEWMVLLKIWETYKKNLTQICKCFNYTVRNDFCLFFYAFGGVQC